MVKLATFCHFFPLLFPATVFALLLVNSVTNEESSQKPRIFRVNLDLNPSQRWRPVLEVYKKDVIPRIVDMARSYVPNKLRGPVFGLFSRLAHFLPKEYGEELAGIAEYLEDIGVTLGELVALNLLYDLTDFAHLASRISTNQTVNSSEESVWLPPSLGCTSIVAAREDGTILHARNLDYGMTKLLSDATILVDFVRGGQVKYTSVSFVLFIGVLTGQRPNAFTVSLNARYSGGPWDNLLMELLTRFHHPVAFELRRVLETAPDYVSALAQLSRVPMIAPAYIIVGGMAGDGAIITRDRLGAADIFFLDYLHHRWFQLETNYDPWKKAGDKRRKYGRRFMKQIGHRNISASTLFGRVLTRPPIWNKETVYSTVMSAEQPQLIYNTTVVWKNDVAEESNPI